MESATLNGRKAHILWPIKLLFACSLTLTTAGLVNYFVDPMQIFRTDMLYPIDHQYQRIVNAGIIRTSTNYDAVLTGSSYSGNMSRETIRKLFDRETLIISAFGASAYEITSAAKLALDIHPGLKAVFLEASVWNLCNMGVHPFWQFPSYLYEGDPRGGALYLASIQTLWMSLKKVMTSHGFFRREFSSDIADVHEWFTEQSGLFKDSQRRLSSSDQQAESGPSKYFIGPEITTEARRLVDCFKRSTLPVIANHPHTAFYIYNPPVFQWAQWRRRRSGELRAHILAQEEIAALVNDLPNAQYYDFQAAIDLVSDCSRWIDFGHFDLAGSEFLLRSMAKGDFKRTNSTNLSLSDTVWSTAASRVNCQNESE